MNTNMLPFGGFTLKLFECHYDDDNDEQSKHYNDNYTK